MAAFDAYLSNFFQSSTTLRQCYILELDSPFRSVDIQYMPRTINHPRSPDIQKLQVVGLVNPNYQYTGGEDILSFSIDYYAEFNQHVKIQENIETLKDFTRPNEQGLYPRVKVIFGKLFREHDFILKNVNPQYTDLEPFANFMPIRAKIDLTFLQLLPQQESKLRFI